MSGSGLPGVGQGEGGVVGDPQTLDEMERRFLRDIWDTAVEDAVVEYGIEARRYGPVLAMAVTEVPREPRFNLLLGVAEPPAIANGHLADADEWFRSLGANCYVPVTPDLGESEAAEAWLRSNGYEPRLRRARFIRGIAPPDFPEPAGIEVDELTDPEVEGECFSYLVLTGYGLNLSFGTFYFDLPGKEGWRCYAAIDEEESAVACGAMRIDEGIAHFGLDATRVSARGRGCQPALLRRRIVDAAAAGCHTLFAETEEALDDSAGPSRSARNLERAGFERVSLSTVWGLPQPLEES